MHTGLWLGNVKSIHYLEDSEVSKTLFNMAPKKQGGPISVAARSKAQVCGRALAEIVGSNPIGGMDVCLVQCLCCQVEVSATGRSLLQRSPTVCGVCLNVIK
jgi:hypothetical protein